MSRWVIALQFIQADSIVPLISALCVMGTIGGAIYLSQSSLGRCDFTCAGTSQLFPYLPLFDAPHESFLDVIDEALVPSDLIAAYGIANE